MEAELDNLRLALDWAFAREGSAKVEDGLRLAVAMGRFWADRCYFAEGRSWIERGLAGLDGNDPAQAALLSKAYLTLGNLAAEQIDPTEARRLLERSVELSRQSGDQETLSQALLLLGFVVYVLKEREKAHAFVDESLALCRAIDYRWGLAMALAVKGRLLSLRDTRFEEARRYTEESIQLFLETGARLEAFANYSQLGWIDYWTGKYAQARLHAEAALGVYRQNKDRAAMAYACDILTGITYLLGDFQAMLAFAQEAADHRRWVGHPGLAIENLFWVGIARIESGQISAAAQALSEHLSWLVEQNNRLDIPFALMGWSRILSSRGEQEQAARLLGAARALFDRFHFHPGPDTTLLSKRSLEAARAGLAPDVFAVAWAEGQAMTIEQAVDVIQSIADT